MKKFLWMASICMGLAVLALPAACVAVNGEKENITISEEILSGDPSAARNVTLRIASHWRQHLLWDTEYRIGGGDAAKTTFSFSPKEVEWERKLAKSASASLLYRGGFGTCTVDGTLNMDMGELPYPEILKTAAEQIESGGADGNTFKIDDYYEYHPISFELEGSSVEYLGDYQEGLAFLAELFGIRTTGDWLEITVEKGPEGEITILNGKVPADSPAYDIADASAFVENGCYYAFCLEDTASGRPADRQTNSGIFYLPFEQNDGWIRADLTEMQKIRPLPEDAVPAGMSAQGENLYLAVKEANDYSLLIYRRKRESLEPVQRIPLGQLWTQREEIARPKLYAMTAAEDRLLITWNDNGFSFVTQENGQYRLWYSGHFPLNQAENANLSGGYAMPESNPFPGSAQCLFDGERLVLAAFQDYDSLNVLLAVYNESGELYTGLYRHSGMEADSPDSFPRERILPQGVDGSPFNDILPRSSGSFRPLQLRSTD